MACGRVGLFRFVACCCAGWRVLLSADGVRMRCIGLLYVDIYIYILLLLAWLVARSRARAVAGGLCVWMYTTNQGLFRVVWWCDLWLYRVYICIYIMRLWWCSVGGGGLFVPCMDISIQGRFAFVLVYSSTSYCIISKIQTIFTPKVWIYAENNGKQNFLYGYMQNDSENQNRKSRLHCAICIYHLEN